MRGLLSAVAVRQVAAGERHSAALTFSGSVIVWGSRANGALTLRAETEKQLNAWVNGLDALTSPK